MTNSKQTTPPDNLIERLWQELKRASLDKHHEWRTPILATQGIGMAGPQARTVVLRHADALTRSLRIYTDSRSPKCKELALQPLAQLAFWSRRLSWQLRVSARVTIQTDGEMVDSAWHRMRHSPAANDYLSQLPPGHIQSSVLNTPVVAEASQKHFLAIANFEVLDMDWLSLKRDGHCRARIEPNAQVTWLVA
jgi:pyridoxamine 5'-phosphate oxidase